MNVHRAYEDMKDVEPTIWMTPDTQPPMYAIADIEPADAWQQQKLVVFGPFTEEQIGRRVLDTPFDAVPTRDELPQDYEFSVSVVQGNTFHREQVEMFCRRFAEMIFTQANNELWPPAID